jgi:hypothetical protein
MAWMGMEKQSQAGAGIVRRGSRKGGMRASGRKGKRGLVMGSKVERNAFLGKVGRSMEWGVRG